MNLNELNLINGAKNGDNECIKELISRHSGICVNICKKYSNLSASCKDYIESSKDYIIYNSAKTYDPLMGSKFSTWLANQARYFCLNTINKNKSFIQSDEHSIYSMIDSKANELEKDKEHELLNEENLNRIKNILDSFSNKKIKKCIEKKYLSDNHKTFTQIAEEMGVTVQTVINWHNKFIKFAKQKLK